MGLEYSRIDDQRKSRREFEYSSIDDQRKSRMELRFETRLIINRCRIVIYRLLDIFQIIQMRLSFLPKSIVRANLTSIAILLFLTIFALIHYSKPSLLYTRDGGFRQFGIGYKQKTVVPIWLVAIFLAILCYICVLSYLLFF